MRGEKQEAYYIYNRVACLSGSVWSLWVGAVNCTRTASVGIACSKRSVLSVVRTQCGTAFASRRLLLVSAPLSRFNAACLRGRLHVCCVQLIMLQPTPAQRQLVAEALC